MNGRNGVPEFAFIGVHSRFESLKKSTMVETKTTQSAPTRSISLFGTFVVGFALVGFLLGIMERDAPATTPSSHAADHQAAASHKVPSAVSYSNMHASTFSPNTDWSSKLQSLKIDRPSVFEPVVRTQEMKLAAIADRAINRAFDGAPPVIPHKVEQQSAASCLACHGEGMKLGDRVATRLSHEHFSSCTQCHVEASSSGPFETRADAPNDFAGLYRSGPGNRAYPSAPPTIPHATFLREDCMSCHGTLTRAGLRTTHPWLSNCTQCHAPSAELNQADLWPQEMTR